MAYEECTVVGRNAVMEAYRSGKTIDKLFILDGCKKAGNPSGLYTDRDSLRTTAA